MCQALHWCWNNRVLAWKKIFLGIPSQSDGSFLVRDGGYGFASQRMGGDQGGAVWSSRCRALESKMWFMKALLHSGMWKWGPRSKKQRQQHFTFSQLVQAIHFSSNLLLPAYFGLIAIIFQALLTGWPLTEALTRFPLRNCLICVYSIPLAKHMVE